MMKKWLLILVSGLLMQSVCGAEALKIMCVGDSITAGYTDNPNWTVDFNYGYRSGLYTRLVNSGYDIEFAGGSPEPWDGKWGVPSNTPSIDLDTLGQDDHCGYGGETPAFVDLNINAWLSTYQPDVVLLMAGINGMSAGNLPAWKTYLSSTVSKILNFDNEVKVIVAQITPLASYDANIVAYNDYIKNQLVPSFVSFEDRVLCVDQYRNFIVGNDRTQIDPAKFSNGINHPNTESYELMAATWFTGLQQLHEPTANELAKAGSLRCEYLENPVGLDVAAPRLSWKMISTTRGQKQTAYQILVASSQTNLDSHVGDLWDSGQVTSDNSIHVAYNGTTLSSGQPCFWKVRVWDKDGVVSNWSLPATWTMGLLNPSDWVGKWISTEVSGGPADNDAVYIRRTFSLASAPDRATAHVNVRGFYELYVNGQKVSDEVLAPAVTGIDKKLLVRSYDISSYLTSGDNCVGIWQGLGWMRSQQNEGVVPLTRAQLNISVGGQDVVIGTDSSWSCAASSHTRLGSWAWNNMGGERIDARRAIDKWSEADGPSELFLPVVEVSAPAGTVEVQMSPPNRISEVIPVQTITDLGSNTWEIDFGKNLTGWVRLQMPQLSSGQTISLRYADKRFESTGGESTPSGHRSPQSAQNFGGHAYQIYSQLDEYISAGNSNEEFCSKFNYHGFRYVIVQGLPSAPSAGDLEALMIDTALEDAGSFECSKELFNNIHEVNAWTIRCLNLGSQMADCPHRERMGYGDGQTSIETQIMNRNSAALYSKWAKDWIADQRQSDGWFPHTSPNFVSSWGGPGWGGLGTVLPWKVYQYYGDARLLEEAYEPMLAYTWYLENKCTDHILRQATMGTEQFLGDWVPPGRGMDTGNWPGTLACEIFNNAYRVYLWEIMEKAARALGKTTEADEFAARIATIRQAIHNEFYDAANSQYGLDEGAYQLMPLMTGIVPENLVGTVQQRLEEIIRVKNNGHLDTGMLGTYFLVQYLQNSNQSDLLYTVYNQETYPSWGYMLSQGATTFWEQWNGHWSQIHSCFASPGSWFYQGLGGIRLDPAAAAFKKMIIRPEVVGDLTWVNSDHDSSYGRIVSNWRIADQAFTLDVEVPPNTTATVYVPVLAGAETNAQGVVTLTESGTAVAQATGITVIEQTADAVICEVEPGSYSFRIPLDNTAPTVNAGQDQSVTLNDGVMLVAEVIDDGFTTGPLATTWSSTGISSVTNDAGLMRGLPPVTIYR